MRVSSTFLQTEFDFNQIKYNSTWDNGDNEELAMHKIHVYPAKFPSFLISKSLQYAKRNGVQIDTIGDIFCGCGTTALEAKKSNINFWGCDINPVATLIAKVKSERFDDFELLFYYDEIVQAYKSRKIIAPKHVRSHGRIKYWFKLSQINRLYKLLQLIKQIVPEGKYQDFFLVAFSNILKGSSRWLTKSIKPTIDKNKKVNDIEFLFRKQFNAMIKAVGEFNEVILEDPDTKIVNANFLGYNPTEPILDMLITSPPYVVSYEYADLHQLSTLWLGYTNDFRSLREGTIGSLYHNPIDEKDIEQLNEVGKNIYDQLVKAKKQKSKSIAKYFLDMNNIVVKTHSIVKPGGLAVFVIGNTKYKGINVDNAKYLTKCMIDQGFCDIDIHKRRISSKKLPTCRDKNGKFSTDKRKRKVYSYEFVIIAKKKV